MKKFLKILALVIGSLVVVAVIAVLVISEPLPTGKTGVEADVLAKKMLKALNYEAYKKTQFLEWSFRNGAYSYVWDKKTGRVKVTWDNTIVEFDQNNPAASLVTVNTNKVTGTKKEELVKKAVSSFNNDSFWLVAPYKVFDAGTKRSTVRLEDGSKALLVTYTTGGDTPGDSYLWLLNDNGFPNSFKMWVKIVPIGGLEATWDDWQVMESGAFLPKSHQLGPMTLSMGEVRGYP
ncbi:Hypothetical protein I595_415 [Croceitalea dokdonensis DOKDO 023]|uniref:Uncharacterized protein n=1 Tax=Croceitalea dokdonensis DOKDO 023 TaxID=1300341 RepID=A0A0P7B492_9FLAO|nr:hypothetical protein [Croceitalea dokdonensis]KPM33512.1 Hypothetical protein I595_415 [Croceitalea dokdonensis DOKDO 023]